MTMQLSNNIEALKVLINKPSSGSIVFREDISEDQTIHIQILASSTKKRRLELAEACLAELNRGATVDLRVCTQYSKLHVSLSLTLHSSRTQKMPKTFSFHSL